MGLFEPTGKRKNMKRLNLIGQSFGRLKVIAFDSVTSKKTLWKCKCVCGNQVIVIGARFRQGLQSCGCLRNDRARERQLTHGLSKKIPEYYVWMGMKQRCSNPNHNAFHNYGAKNIKVCDRWLHSFPNFYNDMGPRPSKFYTIERTDNNSDYSPRNCIWATRREQARNTAQNHKISFNGETMILTDWAEKLKINRGTLKTRICQLGWSTERALTTPVNISKRRKDHPSTNLYLSKLSKNR